MYSRPLNKSIILVIILCINQNILWGKMYDNLANDNLRICRIIYRITHHPDLIYAALHVMFWHLDFASLLATGTTDALFGECRFYQLFEQCH